MEVDKTEDRLVAPRDFTGPIKQRRCTDCLWLLLIIASWAIMTGIGLATTGIIQSSRFPVGNPYRVLRGIDYKGNICGHDSQVKNLPNKYEPNETLDNKAQGSDGGQYVPPEYALCLETCPLEGDQVYDTYDNDRYWIAPLDTVAVLGYCIPYDGNVKEEFAQQTFADIVRAKVVIGVLGFPVAMVLSFGFTQLIRIPYLLRLIVWGSIFITFLVLAGGAYYVIEKANKREQKETPSEQNNDTEVSLLKALGYFLAAAAFLWMCIVCFLRERISLAVGIVREAGRALGRMPALMLFPIMQLGGLVAFFVVWIYFCLYLVSSGHFRTRYISVDGEKTDLTYKTLVYNEDSRHAIIFMVFIWFWTSTFIQAVGQLSVSLAVSRWYFCKNKSSYISSFTVIEALGIVGFYHLGTAAFGSFIIAIVATIRTLLLYIEKKFSGKETFLAKFVLNVMICCLWCFEQCLKFLNKNAYVQTALFGYSFCTASRKAFTLVARNFIRIGAVALVADFVMFVGKIFVMVVCGALAYYYFNHYMSNELNGLVLPTIITAVLAFQTGHLLLEIIAMTANTILQCFIADEEMFAGIDCYAEQGLKEYVFDYGSGSKSSSSFVHSI